MLVVMCVEQQRAVWTCKTVAPLVCGDCTVPVLYVPVRSSITSPVAGVQLGHTRLMQMCKGRALHTDRIVLAPRTRVCVQEVPVVVALMLSLWLTCCTVFDDLKFFQKIMLS